MAPRSKVLYLVGTTRCGSTLVGSLLDQVPGIVHVGELARIWEEGFLQNYRCGCGTPFADCPFWTQVLERAFGGRDRIDPRRMIDATERFGRMRHVVQLATARGRDRLRAGMAEYTDAMSRVYRAILEVAGARTVLDSSKLPQLAWFASEDPALDVWVLHVTRDPRAVSYSWKRRKFDPAKGEDLYQERPLRQSLTWLTLNGIAAAIWAQPARRDRYRQVRYEDLTEDPRGVLDGILDWFGESTRAAEIIDGDSRFVGTPAHTIAGNPMRFEKGPMAIKADTEWHDKVSTRDKLLVAGLTWPLLGRYRYPVLP